MPTIDSDLARLVGMIALGAIVLELLVLMSMLSKLRASVDRAREEARTFREGEGSGDVAPAVAEGEGRPDRAEAQASPESEPAPRTEVEPEPPTAAEPEPEPDHAPATRAEEPAPKAAEPAAAGAAGAPAEAGAGSSPAAHEPAEEAQPARAEPEEEPFERDGRWWFRRGNELLVYDEQEGQWKPAPNDRTGAGESTSQLETTSLTDVAGTEGETESAQTGWKCASCGAVNGSTSTTCRMCFAARP